MGCGKSKHDVVTGITKTIRKPSEAESVKGKEGETMKRQESCRCQKSNDISAVENNTKKPEEKEPITLPPVTPIVPENAVTEEKETTISPPVRALTPENVVTEETVNNVDENVLPVDVQKENTDIQTVVEEEKKVEEQNDGMNDGDVDTTEVPLPEAEEPKSDVETPTTTELEVEETLTAENDESTTVENDEIPALKDEDKVDAKEEMPIDITKEADSA
ncbi:hypothetical protein EUTSA_v10026869mg [Eutrema salsugineum]|uniref:Uncharacterized protein n=1 Tax=Eutrema salsugineum TaxID=72664 RepID=V4LZ05_EUTSA|nr:phosphatidylinositol transfer protein sfh5 [Eutrema salsugineum]ESQ55930.1 hypothetical protein EUTSA_v10026869mg [Eutrema salsugineum]